MILYCYQKYLSYPCFCNIYFWNVIIIFLGTNLSKKSFSWALEIWDALRAAAEADLTLAQAIVDSAGVIVQSADLTICYDERGT